MPPHPRFDARLSVHDDTVRRVRGEKAAHVSEEDTVDADESRYRGFRDFVAARSGALSRTAYLLTGDAYAAEDLLQETLTRAAGRWRKIVAGGDPEPYVRKILYTVHVSRWRHLRRGLLHAELPERRGLDEADVVTLRVVLTAALAQLSPKQRAVLVLRFYDDLTVAATADVLGVSVSTVKSQTAYALAKLREHAGADLASSRDEDRVPTRITEERVL